MFGPKFSYLDAMRALVYLANYTRLGILFAVNLLARYNANEKALG